MQSISQNWDIYPVPAFDVLFVEGDLSTASVVKIYSSTGKLIQHITTPSAKKFKIDISNYPKGIYFIESINKEQSAVKKFIKI